MNWPTTNALLPLCQLPPGSTGRVRKLDGNAHFCQRARELGFGESALVTKIGGGGPFVCAVNGARIALSHAAAQSIIVEQFGPRA